MTTPADQSKLSIDDLIVDVTPEEAEHVFGGSDDAEQVQINHPTNTTPEKLLKVLDPPLA